MKGRDTKQTLVSRFHEYLPTSARQRPIETTLGGVQVSGRVPAEGGGVCQVSAGRTSTVFQKIESTRAQNLNRGNSKEKSQELIPRSEVSGRGTLTPLHPGVTGWEGTQTSRHGLGVAFPSGWHRNDPVWVDASITTVIFSCCSRTEALRVTLTKFRSGCSGKLFLWGWLTGMWCLSKILLGFHKPPTAVGTDSHQTGQN